VEATLTKREKEVARLLAEGLGSKQIAWQLKISQRTVEFHRANIARKLGDGIPALVRYAIREGLISS
jgi:DNA-binding CsgD family transcriptional regulator